MVNVVDGAVGDAGYSVVKIVIVKVGDGSCRWWRMSI